VDYVLTDLAAAHYWLGRDFVTVADWADFAAEIACFPTRAAAEEAVRRHRPEGCHLRAAPHPRYGLPPAPLRRRVER
jgi:hypothetical protein